MGRNSAIIHTGFGWFRGTAGKRTKRISEDIFKERRKQTGKFYY